MKKMNFVSLGMLGLLTLQLYGCASARRVEIVPGEGGTVAVAPSTSAEARQKADVIMKNTCTGKSYKIIKEGEVVVGQVTYANSNNYDSLNAFSSSTSTSAETTNKTEWRIQFKCL